MQRQQLIIVSCLAIFGLELVLAFVFSRHVVVAEVGEDDLEMRLWLLRALLELLRTPDTHTHTRERERERERCTSTPARPAPTPPQFPSQTSMHTRRHADTRLRTHTLMHTHSCTHAGMHLAVMRAYVTIDVRVSMRARATRIVCARVSRKDARMCAHVLSVRVCACARVRVCACWRVRVRARTPARCLRLRPCFVPQEIRQAVHAAERCTCTHDT